MILQAYELYRREKADQEGNGDTSEDETDDETDDEQVDVISEEEKKNRISEWQNSSRILSEAIIHIFQQWIAHQQNSEKEGGAVEVADNHSQRR